MFGTYFDSPEDMEEWLENRKKQDQVELLTANGQPQPSTISINDQNIDQSRQHLYLYNWHQIDLGNNDQLFAPYIQTESLRQQAEQSEQSVRSIPVQIVHHDHSYTKPPRDTSSDIKVKLIKKEIQKRKVKTKTSKK